MTATIAGATTAAQLQADASAKGILNTALAQYGLTSLSDWAWGQYTGGASTDQILLQMRQQPQYKTRFPAMETLAQRGQAITEAQYVNYEQSIAQQVHAAGLPAGYYNNSEDIAQLLENNVSVAEFSTRLQKGYVAVSQAPPEVRAAFARYYGPGSDGALASYFLYPTKAEPLLEKQVAAGAIGGEAAQFGLNVSQGLAEKGASLNQSDYFTRSALSALPKGITQNTLGEQMSGTSLTDDQAAGAALGLATKYELEQRSKARAAQSQGSGNAAATQAGVVGAGNALP